MNIQHYLNERVEGQINYYERKGSLNKTYYLRFKVAQMIAAALLPFASVFIVEYGPVKYLVAFLGTVVTILEGILAIGKYHEKWINYRSTAEALQQEKFVYLMHAGTYVGREAATSFVNRIELILGKENKGWQQMAIAEPPIENKYRNEENGQAESGETNGNEGAAVVATTGNEAQAPSGLSSNSAEDETAQTAPDELILTDPTTGVSQDSETDTDVADNGPDQADDASEISDTADNVGAEDENDPPVSGR